MKQGNTCHLCDSADELTLHHILRRKYGGATEEDNLLIICKECHDIVHDGVLSDLDLIFEVGLKRATNLMDNIKSKYPS